MPRPCLPRLLCVLLFALSLGTVHADSTWVYAVQISAVVQVSPPQITLNWEQDQYGANSYTISRKAKDDTSWGAPLATLSGSITNYTDTNVVVGATYEYQIIKAATLGYLGTGYIFSGINANLTDKRGTLILIVATNSTDGLSNELALLQSDLTGDGWLVLRHDVSSNDTPQNVRALITNDYYRAPTNVNTVFLFGHVPILQSGNLIYDTHYVRPMPADGYYGDMNDDWPVDPTNSPSYMPSDIKLMVGRVDLANMPGVGAAVPFPSELELLRNYLRKDHLWRNKMINVQRRALVGNRRGDEAGEATAADGFRNFEPFVGPNQTLQANVQDNAPPEQRWISMLTNGSYLWAYGCGGGEPNGDSDLGTNGQYDFVLSTDVVGQDAQVPFVMVFGSYFGNWDVPDDFVRSFLATPTMGLAACMAGRPHWFAHHMGLGETFGYTTRLTMNNSNLYQCNSNGFTRAVYIGLMGDPALRMDPVAPPSGLTATANGKGIALNWNASPDAVGYHVYSAPSPAGPFTRLTSQPIVTTNYIDSSGSTNTYMVRAVALTSTPSGTYFNASQGLFLTPQMLQASMVGGKVQLSWNSQPGLAYHVQTGTSLGLSNWTNASGSITATGLTTSWTDTNSAVNGPRFYRTTLP